jgi:hypothetical protein
LKIFVIVLFIKYHLDNGNKEEEVHGLLSHMIRRHVKGIQNFSRKNLEGRDHFEDLVIDGMVSIKNDVKEIWCEGLGWIQLAQDRDQWWVLVKTVMKLRFHKRLGIP